MFRLLVAGGRDFYNYKLIDDVLTAWLSEQDIDLEEIVLIHGDAQGVDRISGQWAKYNSIAIEVYPADWTRLGKRAGHIRNAEMIQSHIDYAILFPGGNGTANMKMHLQNSNIEFLTIFDPNDSMVYTK